jgi:hypothetical protein
MDPNFIVIGPGRTGTTLMYQVFQEHPQICTPLNVKETNFFNDQYHRGFSWYAGFFQYCQNSQVSGEISNTYFFDPIVAERIQKSFPEIRIISILRNPIERMLSAFRFRQSVGEIEPGLRIQEAVQRYPDLVSDNFYGSLLKPYYELFPEQNLLVLLYDQLVSSPEEFFRKLYLFLGVDENFQSQKINQRVNPSRKLRLKFISPLIRFYADAMRKLQLYGILEKSKEFSLIQNLLYTKEKGKDSRELWTEPEKKDLWKLLLPEIRQTEELTGYNLESWYSSYEK